MGNALQTPLGDLAVIRATIDRARSVLELRDDLARWMLEHDVEQWRPGELPMEWIQTCVSYGWVYVVLHDERVIASVTIVWNDPLMWGDRPDPAGYIHMLMVERAFAGHGIGRALLAWAEDFHRRLRTPPHPTGLCQKQPAAAALLPARRVRAGWLQSSAGGRVGV
jgi:GNAT superfamily N-acetyltransferase